MTTFKEINEGTDVVNTKTLLHEAIPLTGTIVSGTYGDNNIKNYSHGMFQSVFDYPYLSSSANHIFDITFGYSPNSPYSASTSVQNSKKINVYNQMAQVLNGFDIGGSVSAGQSIKEFDADGDLLGTTGDKMRECYFLAFSRLLVKDEIKKGTFSIEFAMHPNVTGAHKHGRVKITDAGAASAYKINSPVGEYGILYADTSNQYAGTTDLLHTDDGTQKAGLIYYQAGVCVLTASLFMTASAVGSQATGRGLLESGSFLGVASRRGFAMGRQVDVGNRYHDMPRMMTGSHISASANALRNRVYNIQFNNTVELNSQIYFCRIAHNEFNYSSNPTYLTGSKIRVKNDSTDTPVAYITSVGLYDSNDMLLAVGKLSEPLRKDPTIEYTLRARLDY